jgi:hypothetical protein
LAHYWQNLCVNDILHILQFGKVCMPFALQVLGEGSKK